MDKCKWCGEEVLPKYRMKYGMFCSCKCYDRWNKEHKTPNCKCAICGKEYYAKPSFLKRIKYGASCSRECSAKFKAIYSKGEGNHQYGLIGDKNASFKKENLITNYGYIIEYAPGHPFPHDRGNKGVRVLQHRLVIERNYHLFDPKYFLIIDGKHYLKPEYVVHHINQNKQDNRLENLQIMLRGEHSRTHCLMHSIIRNPQNGRIIGVSKSGKNGEPCDGNTVLTSLITNRQEGSVEHRS